VAFRDVTPERMRRPQSVLVVNCCKIPITLIDRATGAAWPVQAPTWAGIFPACPDEALPTPIRSRVLPKPAPHFPFWDPTKLFFRNFLDFTSAIKDKQYIADSSKCPPPPTTRFFPRFSP
jgi:hypothetical protein